MPPRIELRAPGDRWVDVHPVAFGPDGTDRQAVLDGGFFRYPPDAFGRGLIAGRAVPVRVAATPIPDRIPAPPSRRPRPRPTRRPRRPARPRHVTHDTRAVPPI